MMLGQRSLQRITERLSAYDLEAELGRGNWGVVYAGRHRALGREVAIKILPPAFAADEAVRARFVREAKLAASLQHPHIVPVFDFLTLDDGSSLIVMERCVESVAKVVEVGPWGPHAACVAVASALAALDHAHQASVLHRDVKPENLLVDRRGVVKLADFGIAREESDEVRLTATGTVLGTPAYLSPEQASGEPVGPASDSYSAGVMLFELLSGRLPFSTAKSVGALIKAHLVEEPPGLSSIAPTVGPNLSSVVARALAKRPDQRWPTARAFYEALLDASANDLGADWLSGTTYALVDAPTTLNLGRQPEVVGMEVRSTVVVEPDASGRRAVLRAADGRTYSVMAPRTVIGRGPSVGITVDEASISREHAVLMRTGDRWQLHDLGSTNGTFVNDVEIVEAELEDGDLVCLGTCSLTFHLSLDK